MGAHKQHIFYLFFLCAILGCDQKEEKIANLNKEHKNKLALKYSIDSNAIEQLNSDLYSLEVEDYFNSTNNKILVETYIDDIVREDKEYYLYFSNTHYFKVNVKKSIVDKILEVKSYGRYDEFYLVIEILNVMPIGMQKFINGESDYVVGYETDFLIQGVCWDVELVKKNR